MTAAVRVETGGGFDDLPAGPALAGALDAVDPTTLPGEEAAAWMRGAFRARNHADWMLLLTVREACSARSGTTVRVPLDEFAPKIAAANLGWTATTAGSRLDLAVGVLERMPALGEAMRTGRLEATEATAFVTGLDGLCDDQCRAVVEKVLPDVGSMGLQELRNRILDAGYAVDQVWGAARLAAATARARVSAETASSGAVNLCGRDLDPNLAQDAKHRLRALALEIRARLRASGHKLPLGFIEARVFVRLMDGTQVGAADDTVVIDALTAELATARPSEAAGPDDDSQGDDGDGPDSADGGPGSPDDPGPRDNGPGPSGGDGPGPSGGDGPGPSGGEGSGPRDDEPGQRDGGPSPRDDRDDPTPDSSNPITGGGCTGTDAARCVAFPPGIGVRLTLATLLGLDDHPGHIPGIGPVSADTARTAARARGAAAWQILVHDDAGHLQHLLTLRAPPDTTRDPRYRRQTVQVTAPAALLAALDPTTPGNATALGGARTIVLDAPTTTWLTRVHENYRDAEAAPPDEHPATTTRERHRRVPSTRLADYIRARDQTCVAPTCTRPAEACDLDHTIDWLHGGTTEADDLDALCRHDHRSKHHGGWIYHQPGPGRFVITDPTGTRHHVDSRVVRPLPARQAPRDGPSHPPACPTPTPREDWAPRRNHHGRLTPEAKATAEHLTRRARELRGEPPSRYDEDPDF